MLIACCALALLEHNTVVLRIIFPDDQFKMSTSVFVKGLFMREWTE